MEKIKVEFLRSLFEQIESQVQFGDTKASLRIAGDAILLAICGGLIKVVSGCKGADFTVNCIAPSITLSLAVIAAAFLIFSLTYALLAAHPSPVIDRPRPELFLLSRIAELGPNEFAAQYKDLSTDDLVEEALTTIHGKAEYATKKFKRLKLAIQATLLSLGFMVATPLVAIVIRVTENQGVSP
jgi:hypothetical protein